MNLNATNPIDLGLARQPTMKPSDRLPFAPTEKERAVLGIPKPGNVFGSGVEKPKIPAPQVTIEAVARRYFEKLLDRKAIEDLRAIAAELEKIQTQIDSNSPTISDRITRELSEAHAKNPCAATRRALADSKSLSPADHALAQEYATMRFKEALGKLPNILHPVLIKAVELLQTDVDGLSGREAEEAAAWQTSPAPSPLLGGLRSVLAEFRTSAHAQRFSNIPQFAIWLLKIDAEQTSK
jgi:hypothetical protein